MLQSSRARGNEQEVLSQQVLVMADELEEQLSQLNRLRRLQTARPSSFAQASPLSQALRQASLVPGAQVSTKYTSSSYCASCCALGLCKRLRLAVPVCA